MKYLVISILFLLVFVSCKRDTKIPEVPIGPSARYTALTSHYWHLTNKWYDTTDIGKQNPELIPMSSSQNVFVFTDSCAYNTCTYYNPDGFLYIVKGKWCYPNNNLVIVKDFPWSLTNNDQTLNSYGAKTIIVLNDTIMRSYEYQIYNFTKLLVTVYEHKTFEFK